MLSRVAERMYWIGRYLERCESTARLVGVTSAAALDLPRGVEPGWASLLTIIGAEATFHGRYQNADERNVVRFLLADAWHSASLVQSVSLARENARTTREIMPTESWELINDLHRHVSENAQSGVARRGRHEFLAAVIAAAQQITGQLDGTMSHDHPWQFFRLGQTLERADMSTRIIDACSVITDARGRGESPPESFESVLWMSLLRSLSALQMYRQTMRERVSGEDVLRYLLGDRRFPRAVAFCLDEMESTLRHLPRPAVPLRCVSDARSVLFDSDVETLMSGGLRGYLDRLQLEFGIIHSHIGQTWFNGATHAAGA